jgi:hypothetical protein
MRISWAHSFNAKPPQRMLEHQRSEVVHRSVYEITIRGEATDLVRAEFDDVELSVKEGATKLRADLSDPCALYGLIGRIEAFGLELVALQLVDT